jgi:hypothetical protein
MAGACQVVAEEGGWITWVPGEAGVSDPGLGCVDSGKKAFLSCMTFFWFTVYTA